MSSIGRWFAAAATLLGASCSGFFQSEVPVTPSAAKQDLHSFRVQRLDGRDVDLSEYRGRVVLIVNTASECGFTPQYAGLQRLYERFGSRGFVVLGFPSNEFGGQEPGDAAAIEGFCTKNYGVTFPLFAKTHTKAGPEQAPLYAWLGQATGKLPAWNFGKYLVGKDGRPVAFYASNVKPEDGELVAAIEAALGRS